MCIAIVARQQQIATQIEDEDQVTVAARLDVECERMIDCLRNYEANKKNWESQKNVPQVAFESEFMTWFLKRLEQTIDQF